MCFGLCRGLSGGSCHVTDVRSLHGAASQHAPTLDQCNSAAGMPAAQAAGYPSVWQTVRYALIWRGSLQPGETVLIHRCGKGLVM
jgi:NADPH:quinone reductase-like Zn-dependent oxidoreductase